MEYQLQDGSAWTTAAFSAEGAVFSFNGRAGAVALTNSDVTIAVGKNLTDAIKYSEADKVLTDVNKLNLSTIPPSIPLSFTLASVLPRWLTYHFRLVSEPYSPKTS